MSRRVATNSDRIASASFANFCDQVPSSARATLAGAIILVKTNPKIPPRNRK
jgi:hypothetical protein